MSDYEDLGAPLTIGAETTFGKVYAIGCLQGERYYWMIDDGGTVSMMPASAVDPTTRKRGET